jgi:diguanylate cyclase (GGDEF)-like protein/PAS domain S-box-containing protein
MQTAAQPEHEPQRLAALHALQVLDSGPEAEFDALVRAASVVCGVPISLISLIDSERQWFKAGVGLPGVSETPRDVAFCAHAILGTDVFEVPDATQDVRFADNPLVASQPEIRFYAGAPVILGDGSRVGTLCVIDRQPRHLTDSQREVLCCLAQAAAKALEGRRAMRISHQAAADLADSEQRLRHLYEATPTMLHSIDSAGRLLTVSDTWLSKLGYTRAEVLGRAYSDFLTAASREHARHEVLPAFLKTGRCDGIEYQMLTRDGVVVDVLLSAILARDEAGGSLRSLAVIEDVTLRRRAERELVAEHQRLSNIIEGTRVGTWEWNVQTEEVRLNEQGVQMLGYTLDELGPTTIQLRADHTHPDDWRRCQELIKRHFAGEIDCYIIETRMRHRDGHWIWVLDRGRVMTWTADGKPEWMFGTHQNITQDKEREEAQRKSHSLLDRTGKVAGVGGWDVDLVSGQLFWSDETCRIHGLAPGYCPTMDEAINFYVPEARPVIQAAVETALAGEGGFDLALQIKRVDGQLVWVRAVGSVEFVDGKAVRLTGAFQDITESRRLNAALAEQHELLRVTLRSIGDAVITTDALGHVMWMNPVAERMTGWLTEQAKGRALGQVFCIVNEETRAPTENPVATCLEQGKIVGLANHTVLISRDGDEFAIEDSAAPIRNDEGDLLGVVLVFHDVTEQRRMSGEMSYRASHDSLTGLVNRAEFETRLRRSLRSAQEDGSEHALLYIDLDQFKLVNDACGHAVGDQLLQQVSRLLQAAVRDRDTLARLGGDEFGVILEHCTAVQAQRVAQQICERMEDFRFLHDGRRFRIGASIGLVPMDKRWSSTEAVLQAADTSCYAAKEAGRNRVHAWFDTDKAMRARHGEMQWTSRIEQALDEDRFVLFAQRIEPANGAQQGVHAEVLLRLLDHDGSLVAPGAFLPAAERFNLASRIDRWVLKRVMDWMNAVPSLDMIENISVNLSGQSIGDRAFHRWAMEVLATAGAPICERLCLEITETAAVTNFDDAALFIEQVRALGVRVALDDFGAGASSFGYLKSLPVDYLKIDGQFVRDVTVDPLDDAAVRCFVDVAKVVGVKTVAEFVDQPAVLARLQDIGVDYVQGYLLHRPSPIDELLRVTQDVLV